MTAHPLDRPVWRSLTTVHAAHALGDNLARRFIPEIGPLAGTADNSEASREALGNLARETGEIVIAQTPGYQIPDQVVPVWDRIYWQMLHDGHPPREQMTDRIEPLGDADAPEMQKLAAMTQPGPFAARTHKLGAFWGVKLNGHLIAMAGERLRIDGFAEVSAVCTHPDHQGEGLGRALSAKICRAILERGETPFLHVHQDNPVACGLYETLGFSVRTNLRVVYARPV